MTPYLLAAKLLCLPGPGADRDRCHYSVPLIPNTLITEKARRPEGQMDSLLRLGPPTLPQAQSRELAGWTSREFDLR